MADYEELNQLAQEQYIIELVTFVRNVSDMERTRLLKEAECVLYTPTGEHFVVVPLDAMTTGTTVVAVDSGGLRDTVEYKVTGFFPNLLRVTLQKLSAPYFRYGRCACDG